MGLRIHLKNSTVDLFDKWGVFVLILFLFQQGVIYVLNVFFMNAAFIAIVFPAEGTGSEKNTST